MDLFDAPLDARPWVPIKSGIMVTCELSGEVVDSASEAWRHDCEVRWVLDVLKGSTTRHLHLFGVQHRDNLFKFNKSSGKLERDEDVKPAKMSIIYWRGLERADQLMADVQALHAKRNAEKAAKVSSTTGENRDSEPAVQEDRP